MRKAFLAALLAFVAPMAGAQQQAGEQLFLIPPQGWTIVYHDQKGATDLTELAPPGQSAKDWTEMLTVEMIQGKPTMDVQTILGSRLDVIHKGCDDVGAGPPQLSAENGYESGVRAFACPKTKQGDRGEISLYKVFLGQDRTYVISRAWSGKSYEKDKMPLPASSTEEWLAFMSKVVLCDPRARNHPCPSTK